MAKRNKAVAKLDKENEKIIQLHKSKEKDYKEIMEKEVKLDLVKFPYSLFSSLENLKGSDWENLLYFDLIDEEN